MIRLTAALLTLGIGIAMATTALAQGQSGCWWSGCNPEANLCRLLCGSDNPWPAPYYGAYSQQRYYSVYPQRRSFHRHIKQQHKPVHYSG